MYTWTTSSRFISHHKIVFTGNPGVGKSTIGNVTLDEARFKLDIQLGGGLITEIQWEQASKGEGESFRSKENCYELCISLQLYNAIYDTFYDRKGELEDESNIVHIVKDELLLFLS